MFLKRLSKSELKKIKFRQAPTTDFNAFLTNYYFIDTKNIYFHNRIKDRAHDVQNGVFHFNIGQSTGMVKKIEFSKAEAKFQEEALLTSTYKMDELELFRRIYNVKIEMYGNSSFIPGQLFYVDPATAGFGAAARDGSIARNLGLGGYYVAIAVNNNITRGSFTTSIEGRWVGFGDYRKHAKGPGPKESVTRFKTGPKCDAKERERIVKHWENQLTANDASYKIQD